MLNSTIDYSKKLADEISNNTTVMLDDAKKAMQLSDNSVVSSFINAKGDRHLEALNIILLLKIYRQSYILSGNIKNVYIVGEDGVGFNEVTGVYNIRNDSRNKSMYQTVADNADTLLLLNDNSKNPYGDEKIIIGENILQAGTKKKIGEIIIEFDAQAIRALYANVVLGKTGGFTIIDKTKVQILSGDDAKYKKFSTLEDKVFNTASGYYFTHYGFNISLVVFEGIPNTRWKVVGTAPIHELMDNAYKLALAFLLAIIPSLFLIVLLYNYIVKKLIYSITELRDNMLLAARGDLNATVPVKGNDEISVLQRQYNSMLSQIKVLIKENKQEQRNLQKAELKALQAQINPHFLYNTLDTVIWLAADNDNEKIIDLVEQLSVFFQIGLSKGLEWISVEKEIEHVNSYLSIQQCRYSDLLKFEIDITPQILKYRMLKMTLQPIVENALYHGIKNKEDGGKITIKGYMEGDDILFEICDTGIGMEKETLEKLQKKLQENGSTFTDNENGFGVYNVNRRIRLYYGDGYGIKLWSTREVGTRVEIRISSKTEGEAYV